MSNHDKVSQMSAYLLDRAGGSLMSPKLLKLLYLADRESLNQYGHQISGDQMVSTRHGPSLLNASDLAAGYRAPGFEQWDYWIEARENHGLRLRRAFTREAADLLSAAAITTMRAVFADFGDFDEFQLVEHTKRHCSEWSDPGRGVSPIPVSRILAALGKEPGVAKRMDDELQAQRRYDSLFEGPIASL